MKTHYLDELKLAELSFVDNPANPFAKVAIFKRADEAQPEITRKRLDRITALKNGLDLIRGDLEKLAPTPDRLTALKSSVEDLMKKAEQIVGKGDKPGHEFHGNQYTEGGGGGSEEGEKAARAVITRLDNPLSRKPAEWEEIKPISSQHLAQITPILGQIPHYKASDILDKYARRSDLGYRILNAPIRPSDTFKRTPKVTVFTMEHMGHKYLVNTEGANYPRYVGLLPQS